MERRSDTSKLTQGMRGREQDGQPGPLLCNDRVLLPGAKPCARQLQTQGEPKRIRQGRYSPWEGFHPARGTMPASTQPLLERCLLKVQEHGGRALQGHSQALISSHSPQATFSDPTIMDIINSPTPPCRLGPGQAVWLSRGPQRRGGQYALNNLAGQESEIRR